MPKNGARFHFEMPGSVQGWQADSKNNLNSLTAVSNEEGNSRMGNRSLKIAYNNV
jgi:hypothetical protein